MPRIYIGLGSNLDGRRGYLKEAVEKLREQVNVTRGSSLYETAPMYVVDQPPFLNAVIEADAEDSPIQILKSLKAIERQIGRVERERFGPREIDLDLLLYGSIQYRFESHDQRRLEIPHPRLSERRFVLEPLAEIEPTLQIPGQGAVNFLLEKTNLQAASVLKLTDAVLHL